MTTSEVNSLNLLDLPVDILSIILKPLVTSLTPICLCPCTRSPVNPLPILLSHPALHTIATPLLYAGNGFLLDASGPHAQHIRRELQSAPHGADDRLPGRATLLTTRDALRRIARLELCKEGWTTSQSGFAPPSSRGLRSISALPSREKIWTCLHDHLWRAFCVFWQIHTYCQRGYG
ncbi:hypothetical protein QSH57_001409 [Fusarium oxysporum f. sp. vasinfectum]|nr:hypothetical protein QSH57_001409 [Fusarium oxysporum f. sp. vasinfectum]